MNTAPAHRVVPFAPTCAGSGQPVIMKAAPNGTLRECCAKCGYAIAHIAADPWPSTVLRVEGDTARVEIDPAPLGDCSTCGAAGVVLTYAAGSRDGECLPCADKAHAAEEAESAIPCQCSICSAIRASERLGLRTVLAGKARRRRGGK